MRPFNYICDGELYNIATIHCCMDKHGSFLIVHFAPETMQAMHGYGLLCTAM